MAKLQFATLSNLQEFLNLHNVQIDTKSVKLLKAQLKQYPSQKTDTHFISIQKLLP